MSLIINPPPYTPVDPVTEILHGVSVTDPYRWLEDQDSASTRKWLEEQAAYTRSYFDSISGRLHIRKRVEELLTVELVSVPLTAGNRYFYYKRGANEERFVIMMREGINGDEIVLVDPTEKSADTALTVGIVAVSADGALLAYATRLGGEEPCAIEFLDVNRRAFLPDSLLRGQWRGLAFSPQGDGFYYVHGVLGKPRPHLRAVYWHAFGTDLDKDIEVFSIEEDTKRHLTMFPSPDGSRLCYQVFSFDDPRTIDLYIHQPASGQAPRQIVEAMQGMFRPQFAADKLIALTDWNSPNGRIVLVDSDHPQRDAWRDVVPETEARIESFAVAGQLLFVTFAEGTSTRIQAYDLAGNPHGTVPCPTDHGTVRISSSGSNDSALFYSFTSFAYPPTTFRYDPTTGHQTVWASNQAPFDSTSIEVEQVEYSSRDGTNVPMFLVAHKGRRRLGPLPTFLTGYGGFGNRITPQFTTYASFLMEQGFLFAVANIRGGSEFGKEWHLGAKRHNRQNAIDDFISAAEWLLAQGHADSRKLVIGGGSNAGLLVAAALTQRPDLFCAVVCLGPLLDMLRYHKFNQAGLWIEEFGSSEIPEDFPYLRAYSPYHQVRDGLPYPAVMLITGDADTRCNPMHARKMAARLQAATSSGSPILLDSKPTWGHVPVQPLTTRIEALTDRLTFICHESGVNF